MALFRLEELNGRNKGYGWNSMYGEPQRRSEHSLKYGIKGFELIAQFSPPYGTSRVAQTCTFDKVTKWCTETWGDSACIDIWQYLRSGSFQNPPLSDRPNQHWAYMFDDSGNGDYRIYLATRTEASMFKLRWC